MKSRQDDAEARMARDLLEKAGFEVKRVAVDLRHRLRGDVKPKEIKRACRWLLENESGCVHFDMFRRKVRKMIEAGDTGIMDEDTGKVEKE